MVLRVSEAVPRLCSVAPDSAEQMLATVPWFCLLGHKSEGVGTPPRLKAEKALVSALMADSHA